jgi:hypothetical protein
MPAPQRSNKIVLSQARGTELSNPFLFVYFCPAAHTAVLPLHSIIDAKPLNAKRVKYSCFAFP